MDEARIYRSVISSWSTAHVAELLQAIADELDARGYPSSEQLARRASDCLHPAVLEEPTGCDV